MTWEDIMKREPKQGPAEASAFKNNETTIKEVNDAWEKKVKDKHGRLEMIKNELRDARYSLEDIVDDLQVPKEKEQQLSRFLAKMAKMIEIYADIIEPSSTDWTPNKYDSQFKRQIVRSRRSMRDTAEEDRKTAQRLRDRSKKLGEK